MPPGKATEQEAVSTEKGSHVREQAESHAVPQQGHTVTHTSLWKQRWRNAAHPPHQAHKTLFCQSPYHWQVITMLSGVLLQAAKFPRSTTDTTNEMGSGRAQAPEGVQVNRMPLSGSPCWAAWALPAWVAPSPSTHPARKPLPPKGNNNKCLPLPKPSS